MVLDDQAASAAFHGDVDALKAWLAADPSRDVNDYAISPHNQNIKLTLLTLAVTPSFRGAARVQDANR